MNPLLNKFAICNEVYGDWPWERVCHHARETGYRGIEIAPFTLGPSPAAIDASTRQEIRRVAEDHQLQIIGLHWLLAGTSGLHLTSGDSTIIDRTVAYLTELITLCADLGGQLMVFGSPDQRNLPAGTSLDQGQDRAIQLLKQLTPILEQHDVTLALEPLGPEETDFLNTARQAEILIQEIGSDRIGLHLDVKAMSTEAIPIPEIIRQHASTLVHFHANDANRQGPGMGAIEFEPILQALLDVEYAGWVSVEVFDYEPGLERLVAGSFEYLQMTRQNLAR